MTVTQAAEVWQVPGQERAVEILRRAAEHERVGHAWALVGPPASGQVELARSLAAALCCEVGPPGCGRCLRCRQCLAGAHPDGAELEPTGQAHRVEDVRERWLPAARRTAAPGQWKVLVVRWADRMTEQAANAFLKALEEPPPGTCWVLEVTDREALPPTVLSRCQQVPLRPLSPQALRRRAELAGAAAPLAARLAAASLGEPARLDRLVAAGPERLAERREVLARLREQGQAEAVVIAAELEQQAKEAGERARAEGREELAALAELHGGEPPRALEREVDQRAHRREREARTRALRDALDDVAGRCRDALLVACGVPADRVVDAEEVDAVRADAEALGRAGLLAAIAELADASERLETINAQPRLTVEAALLRVATAAMAGG